MNASAPHRPASSVRVRHCRMLEEFQACMALEREVWASADLDVVPLPIFVVAAHTGGQILGAYDGDRLVGFTLALAGCRPELSRGRIYLHSHMTAVAAEYRDRGVGRQLKLFQREEALSRGIALIEWTFDPLELKNAYFNLERLGAVARQYLPNAYGITTSPLHANLPTDRLLAEWWLQSPRTKRCAAEGTAQPKREKEDRVRISVPAHIGELKRSQPEEAARIQGQVREQFLHWFGLGYAATGIEIEGEKGDYLLEPLADPQGAV